MRFRRLRAVLLSHVWCKWRHDSSLSFPVKWHSRRSSSPWLIYIYIYNTWFDSPSGPRPPHFLGFVITLDTPHSMGLLFTRDRSVAETSTWKHTTLTRDNIHVPGGIRNCNPGKRAASESCLTNGIGTAGIVGKLFPLKLAHVLKTKYHTIRLTAILSTCFHSKQANVQKVVSEFAIFVAIVLIYSLMYCVTLWAG